MSQKLSDNILADLPKVLDDKMGVFDGSPPKWRPYNNVAEYQARFPNIGSAETQMFWVRNPTDANKADLYSLRNDKSPYKVLEDVDLTAVYNIINNLLPYGLKGQIIKVSSENTNQFEAAEPLVYGAFVNSDADLDDAKTVFVTREEIFNTWLRFAHGTVNPSNPTIGTPSNLIPGTPLQTNSWQYDAISNVISSTFNSFPLLGFASKVLLSKYTHKATVSSSAADNDRIGLVVFFEDVNDLVPNQAYGMDPGDFTWPINTTDEFVPNQHTLTLLRNRENVNESYIVVYNYKKTNERIIANGSSEVWNTLALWSGAEVDLEVVKTENTIKVRTSEFSDAPGGKGGLDYEMVIDLNADADLFKFKGFCSYGYCCQSQEDSTFTNESVNAGINEIYDIRNGEVWVADSSGIYAVDPDRNVFDEILPRTFIRNSVTGLFAYVKDDLSADVITTTNLTPSSAKGSESFVDSGQSELLIPHGLSTTPTWFEVTAPSDLNARNILNSSVITIGVTNIIITPQFLNNDSETLNFLWKAEL